MIPLDIGEIVRSYRIEHGLSAREMARRCDVSNSYINILEKGKNPSTGEKLTPTVQLMKKLADGMHMPFTQLVAMVNDEPFDYPEPPITAFPIPDNEKSTSATNGERASDLRLQLIDMVMNAPEETLNKLAQIIQMFLEK